MFYILNKINNKIALSKIKNKINGLVLIFFYVFLYFFSNNFIYSQSLEKNDCEYLIPMGNILQIDAELKNIIVRNEVDNCPLKVGDSILRVENNNNCNPSTCAVVHPSQGEMFPLIPPCHKPRFGITFLV